MLKLNYINIHKYCIKHISPSHNSITTTLLLLLQLLQLQLLLYYYSTTKIKIEIYQNIKLVNLIFVFLYI